MTAFEYTATDAKGRIKKGVMEGDTARQVRRLLREKHLFPTEVAPMLGGGKSDKKKQSKGFKKLKGKKIQHHEVVLFTRQFATLLSSGMPLEEALLGVAEQSERGRIKMLIMAVRGRVLEGHPLASGFAEFPLVFSTMFIATVAAGETSGRLDYVLENLADYIEKQYELRQEITSATIYPTMMIFVSVGIVVFLLAYVVPQLVSLFEDSGQTLPFLTVAMIAISQGVQKFGLWILLGIIGFVLSFKIMLKKPEVKNRFHLFCLKVPVLAPMIKLVNTARFCRTLGILTDAGVSILEAMQTATEVVTCLPIQDKLIDAIDKVGEGAPIHKALAETKYFPPMSIHLIATGESSGQLEKLLIKNADNQDKQIENTISRSMTLFEPLMTLVMGGVILMIVLSVLLPIFSLSQNVG